MEEWRAAIGYEGSYEVSNYGKVRSLDRVIFVESPRGSHFKTLRGRVLSLRPSKTGYLRVHMFGRDRYIHQLVAEAFIGPNPSELDVCHRDGDKSNNKVSNLRYDTREGNMSDQKLHGTHWQWKKIECPRGHSLIEPNLVAWKLRKGHRYCLACERTRSYKKDNSLTMSSEDFQDISNQKYKEILEEQ